MFLMRRDVLAEAHNSGSKVTDLSDTNADKLVSRLALYPRYQEEKMLTAVNFEAYR